MSDLYVLFMIPLFIILLIIPMIDSALTKSPDKMTCAELKHELTNSTINHYPNTQGQIIGNYIGRCSK